MNKEINKKPLTTITLKGSEFVYEQVLIVSKHAPLHQLNVSAIKLSKPNVDVDDDDIIRVCRYPDGLFLLTGRNTLLRYAAEQDGVVSIRVVSKAALERCLVPPKVLSKEELSNKFASDPRWKFQQELTT